MSNSSIISLPYPTGRFNIFDSSDKRWMLFVWERLQVNLQQRNATDVTNNISGTGGAVLSNITTDHFTYSTIHSHVFVSGNINFDLSGAPTDTITIDLPLTSRYSSLLNAAVDNGAGLIQGFATTTVNSTLLSIKIYDGSNFTVGANKKIIFQGVYETNQEY